MAITIDKASMVVLPTSDPDIMEVAFDYTKDDLAVVSEWIAAWKRVSFLWSRNRPAAEFMTATQEAIAAAHEEKAEQKTVKSAIIAATSQCKTVARVDPAAKPARGTSADNPLFVKVV
jgi:hypothetical protein